MQEQCERNVYQGKAKVLEIFFPLILSERVFRINRNVEITLLQRGGFHFHLNMNIKGRKVKQIKIKKSCTKHEKLKRFLFLYSHYTIVTAPRLNY